MRHGLLQLALMPGVCFRSVVSSPRARALSRWRWSEAHFHKRNGNSDLRQGYTKM